MYWTTLVYVNILFYSSVLQVSFCIWCCEYFHLSIPTSVHAHYTYVLIVLLTGTNQTVRMVSIYHSSPALSHF